LRPEPAHFRIPVKFWSLEDERLIVIVLSGQSPGVDGCLNGIDIDLKTGRRDDAAMRHRGRHPPTKPDPFFGVHGNRISNASRTNAAAVPANAFLSQVAEISLIRTAERTDILILPVIASSCNLMIWNAAIYCTQVVRDITMVSLH
jgi:hypothetical protein